MRSDNLGKKPEAKFLFDFRYLLTNSKMPCSKHIQEHERRIFEPQKAAYEPKTTLRKMHILHIMQQQIFCFTSIEHMQAA
jgi:hypothetical protein